MTDFAADRLRRVPRRDARYRVVAARRKSSRDVRGLSVALAYHSPPPPPPRSRPLLRHSLCRTRARQSRRRHRHRRRRRRLARFSVSRVAQRHSPPPRRSTFVLTRYYTTITYRIIRPAGFSRVSLRVSHPCIIIISCSTTGVAFKREDDHPESWSFGPSKIL